MRGQAPRPKGGGEGQELQEVDIDGEALGVHPDGDGEVEVGRGLPAVSRQASDTPWKSPTAAKEESRREPSEGIRPNSWSGAGGAR